MKTFSVNAASEVLEKDRRTIVRALRHTKPDAHEGRHPRWRLKSILDALVEHERTIVGQSAQNGNGYFDRCDTMFRQFDTAFDKLRALPTVEARRAAAIKLIPLMTETTSAMRARDTQDGLHEEHVSLRSDRVFFLQMIGFEQPCQWSRHQVWENLVRDED